MFTPLASADIEAAHAWYESQRAGLGNEFRAALGIVWELLDRFPEAGPNIDLGVRRVIVPRFPYAVYYRIVNTNIEVHGCLHQHRDPRAWRERA